MIREHHHLNMLVAYCATHVYARARTHRFGNRLANLLVMRV
jgi:hypothetical protein